MCKKHIVAPPLIVDTMAERSESEQEDEDNSESSVSESS